MLSWLDMDVARDSRPNRHLVLFLLFNYYSVWNNWSPWLWSASSKNLSCSLLFLLLLQTIYVAHGKSTLRWPCCIFTAKCLKKLAQIVVNFVQLLLVDQGGCFWIQPLRTYCRHTAFRWEHEFVVATVALWNFFGWRQSLWEVEGYTFAASSYIGRLG